ncbi:hypothetical protein HDV63DRAFT_385721 [Trichoderma sp. SZMC 28014]
MQNQPLAIVPAQMSDAASASRVYDTRTPACYCGWYCFYGNCGHMYQQHPLTCGGRRTPSGRSGFCKTPAMQHVVRGFYVNARCVDCRRYGY